MEKQSTTGNVSDALKKTLARYYRKQHNTVSLSSLTDDYEVPLVELYVQPPMFAVDIQHRYINREPTKTQVTSYKQLLFSNQDTPYENVYVTANPGVGKTAFSKRLSLVWSQAHDPQGASAKNISEDISAMKQYDFLFFIPLREVDRELCDLDEIILALVESNLSVGYDEKELELCCKSILHEKTCLIILDGLDEWVHPEKCKKRQKVNEILHTKHRPNSTTVTTTRPWKFDVIQLRASLIDQLIEIAELDEETSEKLVSNAVRFLNRFTGSNKSADVFLEKTSIQWEIRRIPYIYLHCVCLWFDGRDIGESKCAVYSSVIDLILERGTLKIDPDIEIADQTGREADMPRCFQRCKYCKYHRNLLFKLSDLAFWTLTDPENRQAFEMNVDLARQHLEAAELEKCVKLGILSRNKIYKSVTERNSKVFFGHASLHEFFAALHICSKSNSEPGIQNNVAEACKTVSSILKMSNVFIFLSGLNSKIYSEISSQLIKVVNEDASIRQYRNGNSGECDIVDDFVNLQKHCIREMKMNGQEIHPVSLQDFFLRTSEFGEESLILVQQNKDDIKSLDISLYKDSTRWHDKLELGNLKSLIRLDIRSLSDWCKNEETLLKQSASTLLCLRICGTFCTNINSCVAAILSMSMLQSLMLQNGTIDHQQLHSFADLITSRRIMTVVRLSDLICSNHKYSCDGVVLDLSHHKNLLKLKLLRVPISQVPLKCLQLEVCTIGALHSSGMTSCLRSLPMSENLLILKCQYVPDDSVSVLIETIPMLKHLKCLDLNVVDLNDRRLLLHTNMRKLETIFMFDVRMTSAALRDLLDSLTNLPQSVSVNVSSCTVTPKGSWDPLMEEIKHSDKFTNVKISLEKFCCTTKT